MTASDFISIWKELEESHNPEIQYGVLMRRISPDISHDIFLGLEKTTSKRMLLFRVNKIEAIPFEQLPDFRGFEISALKFPDEKPDTIIISLGLNDQLYSDIFSALCEDLFMIASREPDQQNMVRYIKERLLQWKQFLEVNGSQGLSPEAQRGLYGELRFLRDILIKHLNITEAVRCWQGPLRKNQDFQIAGIGIEVKTSIAKQHQKIHISNELQLDDSNLDDLYLYFISLAETSNLGETLPEIIDSIRKMIDLNNGPVSEFEDLLFNAGYLDKYRNKYNKTGYHDRDIIIFYIEKGFPRIVENDLKSGIGDVHYSIDLSACMGYRIKKMNFIRELEWIKNGS